MYRYEGNQGKRYTILGMRLCEREGCHEKFIVTTHAKHKRFCSRACALPLARNALNRGRLRLSMRVRHHKYSALIKQLKAGAFPLHELCERVYRLGYSAGHYAGKGDRRPLWEQVSA